MLYLLYEIRAYTRTRLTLSLSLAFASCTLLVFSLGAATDRVMLETLCPHLIWATFFLASLLSFERIVQPDLKDGTLDMLLTSRMRPWVICFTKAVSHWLCTQLPLIMMVPIFSFMLGIGPFNATYLVLALLLGTWPFSFWGTLCACLTLHLPRSSMLSCLLITPLILPSLIFGPFSDHMHPLLLMSALSLFSGLISPWVSGWALKIAYKSHFAAPVIDGRP